MVLVMGCRLIWRLIQGSSEFEQLEVGDLGQKPVWTWAKAMNT
jgi:hypothetical protein